MSDEYKSTWRKTVGLYSKYVVGQKEIGKWYSATATGDVHEGCDIHIGLLEAVSRPTVAGLYEAGVPVIQPGSQTPATVLKLLLSRR